MNDEDLDSETRCYLYFVHVDGTTSGPSPETVFYEAADEEVAKSLCDLFDKQYVDDSGGRTFAYEPAARLAIVERVLLSEALEWVSVYSDPDPTVYDPQPSAALVERGRYAVQAEAWEAHLLRQRAPRSENAAQNERAAVLDLLRAVEKHRLMFLFFGRPERLNPASNLFWERLDERDFPDDKIPTDDIESTGEFLFRHRSVLDRFAQKAVARFGSGAGRRPSVPDHKCSDIEIEGGSLPYWKIDEIACLHLEESADAVLDACNRLVSVDPSKCELARQVRLVTHDEGQQHWYSDRGVRWDYLARMDYCVRTLKDAEIEPSPKDARPLDAAQSMASTEVTPMSGNGFDPRNVFVVHGRNDEARRAMFEFLRSVGLNPMEWDSMVKLKGEGTPHPRDVILKGFAVAHAVVVLLTPDDEAQLKDELRGSHEEEYETTLTGQPRQNVLVEMGIALGTHLERTIIVEIGKLRPISDVTGLHTVRMDGSEEARNRLVTRLQTAGCPASKDGSDWLRAGDFRAVASNITPRRLERRGKGKGR